ncbi:MAG: heparin lyase I family protein, partial [Spirochaetia bacterium]|nr:heparin lyase I family protein [Spirochaetia bacterium]
SQAPIPEAYSQSGQNIKIKEGSHFRAEIRTSPWHEKLPMGTEYWLGWSYFVPDSYIHDKANRMTIFQGHAGRNGPQVELYIDNDTRELILFTHHQAYSNNKTKRRVKTGASLVPGEWIDFVAHIVWDTEAGGRGLTELWINEKKNSIEGGNVFESDPEDPNMPYPGTPKLGMYKWPWRYTKDVNESKKAGVTTLELLVGPVRYWRSTAGEKLAEDGYAKVAPRGARK